ncbi:endonuclease/exonuclease/phosphatase family protein [Salinimicrobium xinjiangense]|uniref:endonuclease/exonuclease/phosphatase family protein n=1 Tax=Salinimicrobium xinjiangense TaxID=438596 RepID=UPI0004055084|nr:endonuclease/exonuclease/phosphatase family protein [Salinimicrobium xinjiangense]
MHLKPFLQGFGILAVILSLFPFVASDYWWIRMFDFPHVQLTILTLVALLVYFFRFNIRSWRDYTFIIVLGACFLLQLTKIFPYTPFSKVEVNKNDAAIPQRSISIMAANVLQKNKEYHMLINEIFLQNPDLIIFTETDRVWQEEIRKGLKNYGYEYRIEMPLDNTYGMLVFSRLELVEPQIRFLLEDSIPSMHARVVLPSRELIRLHVIHPTPPMPPHDASSTDRDAQMMMVAKMAKEEELPVIVAGDFNDVAWSESTQLFQKISGLLDPRIGRGFFNTYNADSWLMRWPLDHLFVSEEFRLVQMHVGNNIESDHFPLYARLSLEPQGGAIQKKSPPDEAEMKEAEDQIKKEDKKDRKEKAEGKE